MSYYHPKLDCAIASSSTPRPALSTSTLPPPPYSGTVAVATGPGANLPPVRTCTLPPLAVPAPSAVSKSKPRKVETCWRCARPQMDGAIYCAVHACTAVNADGSRCTNFVEAPAMSRVCTFGYHLENGRYSYLEDALAKRRGVARLEEKQRHVEHMNHVDFFTANFSGTTTMTTTSRSRGSSQEPRNREERGWGAHGVDKWWVGEWRFGDWREERRSKSAE